jgi:hypothetical protein
VHVFILVLTSWQTKLALSHDTGVPPLVTAMQTRTLKLSLPVPSTFASVVVDESGNGVHLPRSSDH